jgi:hypothetical protein
MTTHMRPLGAVLEDKRCRYAQDHLLKLRRGFRWDCHGAVLELVNATLSPRFWLRHLPLHAVNIDGLFHRPEHRPLAALPRRAYLPFRRWNQSLTALLFAK